MNFNLDGSGSDSNKSFPAAITIIPSSTYPQLSSFAEDQPTAVEDFQEIKAPIKKNCAKDGNIKLIIFREAGILSYS